MKTHLYTIGTIAAMIGIVAFAQAYHGVVDVMFGLVILAVVYYFIWEFFADVTKDGTDARGDRP